VVRRSFLLAEAPRYNGGPSMRAGKDHLPSSFKCGRREYRRPSLGLMARPGKSIAKQSEGRAGEEYLPMGGRVRKLRAVEDQSAPIPER